MNESVTRTVVVSDPHGLHMRSSLAVVNAVEKYQSRVEIRNQHHAANARSVLDLLMFGGAARHGVGAHGRRAGCRAGRLRRRGRVVADPLISSAHGGLLAQGGDSMHLSSAAEAAQECLRRSPYPAITRLSCEQDRDGLVLRGTLPSYYHKQLAQETIRAIADSVRLVNAIEVPQSIPSLVSKLKSP